MKVLFINAFFGRGSTGHLVKTLFDGLKLRGVSTYAVAGFDKPKIENVLSLKSLPLDLNLYLSMLHTRLTGFNGFEGKRRTKKICSYILKIKPDIINIHIAHGGYLDIEYLINFLKKYNFTTVFTMHDCWLMTGHCPHFAIYNCEKWRTECYQCQNLKECAYPKTYFFDRSNKQFLMKLESFSNFNFGIITPCEWLQSFILSSPILKNSRSNKTIHNGVDFYRVKSQNFKPVENLIRKGKKYLLFVSSQLSESKGLKEIIALSKIIPNNYVIALVGKKDETLPIDDSNIIFLGIVNKKEELKYIYENAYAFINMTLADTFPTTLIEALQSGIKVVTYDTGGCAEIKKEEIVFVPELNTPESFLKEILKMENSTAQPEKIIEYGKLFSSDRMIDNYYSYFLEIMKGGIKNEEY